MTPVTPAVTWQALDHWRARQRGAVTFEDRVSVAAAWATAAGGTVDTSGDSVRLHLPDHLPNCLSRVELHRLARDLGLMPKVIFGLDFNDAAPQRRGLS